jgi:transcriptional regulator with XRE-family HTH domain
MKFNIGNRVHLVRSKKQLSQQEMAELLCVSPSAYSRLERNETQVSLEEIPRYAELLKVPVQELLPEMFTVHNQPMLHSNGVVFCTNFYNFSNSKYNKEEIEAAIQDLQQNIENLKKNL